MARGQFSTVVDVPLEFLWELLIDKIEHPEKYLKGVEKVEVRRKDGPYDVLRYMKLQNGLEMVEKIHADKESHTIVFSFMPPSKFFGSFVNCIAQDPQGRTMLSFFFQRTYFDAKDDVVSEEQSEAMVKGGVLGIKEHAEKLFQEKHQQQQH